VAGSGTTAVVSWTPLMGIPLKEPPFRVNVIAAVEAVEVNTSVVIPKAASL
jgi:hypothetical protein